LLAPSVSSDGGTPTDSVHRVKYTYTVLQRLSVLTSSGGNGGKRHVGCAHYVKLTCISTDDDITIPLSLNIYFTQHRKLNPWSLQTTQAMYI
jgi:hypothetical protein